MNNGRIRTSVLVVSITLATAVLFVAGLLRQKEKPHRAAALAGPGAGLADSTPATGLLKPGASPARAATTPATPATAIQFCATAETAPAWSVGYGDEFWRRDPVADTAPVTGPPDAASRLKPPFSLGDVVERVSHAFEVRDGTALPTVTASTYVAQVDERGLTFSPHRPADGAAPGEAAGRPVADAGTEALVRTLGITRGGEMIYAADGGPVERAVVGNTAQGLLAPAWGVVEHFEAGGEGVALSWIFSQPLPGAGPVEVTVALDGLTLAGTDGEGWHFADGGGQARVRFGAAVAVDAAGTRWDLDVQPAAEGNNRLVVALSEEILAEAVFPLAIDPLLSPEFGMGQPVTPPATGSEGNPTVAVAGGQFLVVWEDNRHSSSTGTDLYGTRVSAGGKVLDPAGIAIAATYGTQSSPALAANGTTFLVVWRDTRLVDNDIFGARISAAGVVLDPLGFAICTAVDDQTVPAVCPGAPGFMVVWQDRRNNGVTDRDIYGARVSTAGVVLDPAGLAISTDANRQQNPAVGNSTGEFIVLWEDNRNNNASSTDIYGARVSDGGVLQDALGVPVSTALRAQTEPALVANGGRLLAVWRDNRNNAGNADDIYGTLLRSQGNQLSVDDTNGVAVCATTGNQRSPAVGVSGGGFCVAWRDSRNNGTTDDDIYAARVNNNGVVQETNGVPICTALLNQSAPAVAGNSDGAFIAWTDPRSSTTTANDIHGARFTAAGLLHETNGIPLSLAYASQGNAAVAFNGTNYLVVWEDSRNITNTGVDILGARVTSAGKVLDLRGTNLSASVSNQYNPAVAASAGTFLVVWQDERNSGTTGVDIYATRVSGNGSVTDPAGLTLSTTATDQIRPAVAGDGSTFMVVWQDARGGGGTGNDIYGTRVSSTGTIFNPTGLAISTDASEQTAPALAAATSGFLAVWQDDRNGGGSDVYGARISNIGTVLDAGGIAVSTDGSDQLSPTVASHGTNYLVAWTDDRSSGETGLDIYAGRVLGDGATPDGDGFAVCTVLRDQFNPALAAGPSGYVLAWQDQRGTSTGNEVYTARVGTNGVVLDVSGVPMPGSGEVSAPALAGGGAGRFLLVGEGFRRNSSQVGGSLFTADAPAANLFVQFGAAASSVAEGGRFAKIKIALKGKYSGVVTVDFATADWAATAGLDYAPLAGRIVFANKKTSVMVSIPIIEDALLEGAEIIALRLENPTGGALLGAAHTAALTIVDNEP